MTAPESYDTVPELGSLYDHIPLYAARGDVAFYVSEAGRSSGGTTIELGCGTGRVLLPLARAGHRVVGVDSSREMLDRLREKLAAEPAEVRQRVALHHSDVRDLTVVDATASLVIAPFRVLQHLTTIADQMLCVAAIVRRLDRGGRFAFDVFNPNFAMMIRDRSSESEDTPETPLADGTTLRRTVSVRRVRWVDQVSEVELIYYIRAGDQVSRHVQAFEMRWYVPAELEHLLARAGMVVESMYGNFDRSDLLDDSPEIVVVAAKK